MIKILRVIGFFVIAAAPIATSAWAANETPVVRYTEIASVTNQKPSSNQVAKALSSCSAARGWVFTNAGSGKLVGKLNVRGKHFVEVGVEYNSKAYKITYRDSRNMKYDAAKNTIHRRYNSWVENLDNDVRFCLQ